MGKRIASEINITHYFSSNNIAKEFQRISDILDSDRSYLHEIAKLMGVSEVNRTGRTGMSVESTIRCAILKQYWQLPYNALAYNLEDSETFKAFARLPIQLSPKKTTLQENISNLPVSAWEHLNRVILQTSYDEDIELGKKVRVDTTAIETHVLAPTDNHLLVRAVSSIIKLLSQTSGIYRSHKRKMKQLSSAIRNCRSKEKMKLFYKELLVYAGKTFGYVKEILSSRELTINDTVRESLTKLQNQLALIISQTRRRVILGESVPASEKVVSLHEGHTDIICKDRRETIFGHKVNFVTGASGMVLSVDMPRGNPSDSELFIPALHQVINVYGRPPRQVAADGGFASGDNLRKASALGVKDIAFHKRRGISVEDMCKSNWVYKQLIRFRAGIEGNISLLKRVFGLDRCDWKGWDGFQKYVLSAVVTYNLVKLSRLIAQR